MSTRTRIWVFHMKELIYTAVFIVLGVLFLLLFIFMFMPSGETPLAEADSHQYTAGIYTASMTLEGNPVEIAVTVDEDYISSIRFRQLDEAVSAMYPLMEPALENIAAQVVEKQTTEGITYSADYQYTSVVLLNAIENALAKAELSAAETGE